MLINLLKILMVSVSDAELKMTTHVHLFTSTFQLINLF